MQMGNAEIECETMIELTRLGLALEVREEFSEVFVSTSGVSLKNDGLLKAFYLLANMGANEVSIEDGRLRLWWD